MQITNIIVIWKIMSRANQARHMILLITIDIDRSQPSNNVENILVLNLMEIWQLTLIEDRNKK
jgi:hypothetical protein